MLEENVRTWLQQPQDYSAGLALVRQAGILSFFTLRLLERGADAYTRSRLQQELTAWLVGRPASTPVGKVTVALPATEDLLRPLEAESYQLMDERSELKAHLRATQEDDTALEARRLWAYRILAITRQLDELYSRMDFAREHGYLPLENDEEEVSETQQLLNLRTYISRYQGKLRRPGLSPDQQQKYQALLDQYRAEKQRLERKLTHPLLI
ncbi:hypothetical protein [Larkinella soli]|uniref:hypothetical protein n=1 Tax=Larkinella soli TaxID=1770527 RepID=UPI000FFC7D80|nr:hypothetical protein [Larkinella soli]